MITPKKEWAKVFRKAAELGEKDATDGRGIYCCPLLESCRGKTAMPFFAQLFDHERSDSLSSWWSPIEIPILAQRTEARIVALYLTAEICERGKF